ncbi:MAG: hypothetical protein ACT4P1_04540 [Sporichthyaceae bacterium]
MCTLATLYLFWVLSTPTPSFWSFLQGAFALAVCALLWLVRFGTTVRKRQPLDRWWALAPIGALMALSLVAVQAPLHARFSLADDELAAVARTVTTAPDPAASAKALGDLGRVGTYRVHRVEVADEGVFFTFRRGSFWAGPEGVLYAPDGIVAPELTADGRELDHIRGPWYHWFGSVID